MIVGLSGKIGCGKTWCANRLVELLPNARRMSFADALREEVAALLGVKLSLVHKSAFKGMSFRIGTRMLTGREVLQWWGTEIRRAADPDYWVNQAYDRAWAFSGIVIFDDVRMPNEAQMVQDAGGLLLRIDPYPGWQPGPNASHISETAIDDYQGWDVAYQPEQGLEHLEAVAQDIARAAQAEAAA